MTQIKKRNQLYTFKYDGDILIYKASLLFKPLFLLTRFQTRVEIPLNLVLSYKRRRFLIFNSYKFYINHYSSSQTRLQPISLRSFLLLAGENCKALEKTIEDIMHGNALGIPNMALRHIALPELQRYYASYGSHKTSIPQKTAEKSSLVITKRIPQLIPEAV